MSKTQLYRWFDKDDNLLYVGISYSAMVRASQHKDASHWYDAAVKSTIENFNCRDDAIKAERLAIITEKPKYNVTYANAKTQDQKLREGIKKKLKKEWESGFNDVYFNSDKFVEDIKELARLEDIWCRGFRVKDQLHYKFDDQYWDMCMRLKVYKSDSFEYDWMMSRMQHHYPRVKVRIIKLLYKHSGAFKFYPKTAAKHKQLRETIEENLMINANSWDFSVFINDSIKDGIRGFVQERNKKFVGDMRYTY